MQKSTVNKQDTERDNGCRSQAQHEWVWRILSKSVL